MEKTNSNIPTPEELKVYIDESAISVTGTYEQSASVLMVDDSIIGTLGNNRDIRAVRFRADGG